MRVSRRSVARRARRSADGSSWTRSRGRRRPQSRTSYHHELAAAPIAPATSAPTGSSPPARKFARCACRHLTPRRVPADAARRPHEVGAHRRGARAGARSRRGRAASSSASTISSNRCTPPVALEAAHRLAQLGVDQPEQRGHRRAVAQVRLVLDHDRAPVASAHDDGEASRQGPTEQCLDDRVDVVGRRVAEGQRQNSRVRTRRVTKPPSDEWCDAAGVRCARPSVDTDDGATRGWIARVAAGRRR